MSSLPTSDEIVAALVVHPQLARDVQEGLLITALAQRHPAPGHLIIDRNDGDLMYSIDMYAAREQVKATEIIASNPEFGRNARFFKMSKMSPNLRCGPWGPVVWTFDERRPDRPEFKRGDRVRGTGAWAGYRGTVRSEPGWNNPHGWQMKVQIYEQSDEDFASMQTIWDCAGVELE